MFGAAGPLKGALSGAKNPMAAPKTPSPTKQPQRPTVDPDAGRREKGSEKKASILSLNAAPVVHTPKSPQQVKDSLRAKIRERAKAERDGQRQLNALHTEKISKERLNS